MRAAAGNGVTTGDAVGVGRTVVGVAGAMVGVAVAAAVVAVGGREGVAVAAGERKTAAGLAAPVGVGVVARAADDLAVVAVLAVAGAAVGGRGGALPAQAARTSEPATAAASARNRRRLRTLVPPSTALPQRRRSYDARLYEPGPSRAKGEGPL
jgi:hypothetical protein